MCSERSAILYFSCFHAIKCQVHCNNVYISAKKNIFSEISYYLTYGDLKGGLKAIFVLDTNENGALKQDGRLTKVETFKRL